MAAPAVLEIDLVCFVLPLDQAQSIAEQLKAAPVVEANFSGDGIWISLPSGVRPSVEVRVLGESEVIQ